MIDKKVLKKLQKFFSSINLYEGKIEFKKDYKQPVFECLLCGACNMNCAPVVKTQEIMMAARHAYILKQGQPPLQRFVFRI